MSQNQTQEHQARASQNTAQSTSRTIPVQTRFAHSHYAILGLHPSASVIEIRQVYRELSKRYHPDTTELAAEVATAQFRRLNEAYGILSNPERRSLYDLKIGYSRWNVIQDPHQPLAQSNTEFFQGSKSAYLDASDRPLSAGEIFALLTMGITFLGCLILVIVVAFLRGDSLLPSTAFPQEHRVQFGLSTAMPSLRVLAPDLAPDLAPNLASNLFPNLSLHPKPIHAPPLR